MFTLWIHRPPFGRVPMNGGFLLSSAWTHTTFIHMTGLVFSLMITMACSVRIFGPEPTSLGTRTVMQSQTTTVPDTAANNYYQIHPLSN